MRFTAPLYHVDVRRPVVRLRLGYDLDSEPAGFSTLTITYRSKRTCEPRVGGLAPRGHSQPQRSHQCAPGLVERNRISDRERFHPIPFSDYCLRPRRAPLRRDSRPPRIVGTSTRTHSFSSATYMNLLKPLSRRFCHLDVDLEVIPTCMWVDARSEALERCGRAAADGRPPSFVSLER
ncbi:hypothetical protein EVAR_14784_1 [Eumeta japonica]|uniref:Uncharacterized protein n=1 Tax=Eumeta variegata TaxID=151549 RepID=A0A4C1TWG0_EUMVA|nr:hypothetical protein EVAR_14784_1 [Eumeta japonica]